MVEVRLRNGDMLEVACEPTGVPGLVAHPEVLHDESPDGPRYWMLTVERTGEALISGLDLICLGEVRYLARLLAPLHDWSNDLPTDPQFGRLVMETARRALAWRQSQPSSLVGVIAGLQDLIVTGDARVCDGTWHRVAFGWGHVFVRAGSGNPTWIWRVSSTGCENDARTLWCYDDHDLACVDCGSRCLRGKGGKNAVSASGSNAPVVGVVLSLE